MSPPELDGVEGEHLCPICKLGKSYNTVTCKDIMGHAGGWNNK